MNGMQTVELINKLASWTLEDVEVSFVPEGCSCKCWTWIFGKWVEEQTVDYLHYSVANVGKSECRCDGEDVKVFCCQHLRCRCRFFFISVETVLELDSANV